MVDDGEEKVLKPPARGDALALLLPSAIPRILPGAFKTALP